MTSDTLDPTLLDTFLDVLRHGGIGAAARASDLSQPAVTARMRRLEESLGTPLLTRSPQGVAPTPAGDKLAEYARRIRLLLDEAAVEVPASDARLGRLSLVASSTIAARGPNGPIAVWIAVSPTSTICAARDCPASSMSNTAAMPPL